jgi:hypothetical protein
MNKSKCKDKTMSFFDQIAKAETYNTLPYVEPGEFTFQIDSCLHVVSKQGKGDFLIAEFTVLESETASEALKAGGRCSIRCKLSDIMGPKNAKAFLVAAAGSLAGKPVSDLKPEDQARLIGPNSQLVGVRVKASAFLKPKKTKPGENYTHVNWFPVLG